jgi:hypothetical protein
MQHQVRREALGGTLAFDAASRELDLADAWVVMRNDAVGALAALRKGCSSSTFLQQCAMRLAMLHRTARCHPLFLHAPGSALVSEGVDGLSRDTAAEVAGPVSSPLVRHRASALAQALGWELTVDAFASESNSLLPRFFARYFFICDCSKHHANSARHNLVTAANCLGEVALKCLFESH